MTGVRIAIVGGGVAGTLLAWRLRQAAARPVVHLYTAEPTRIDATGASGGMVRGFEVAPEIGRSAVASLAELRADSGLRDAVGYREIGSMYLLPPGAEPAESVRLVEEALPGSATVHTDAATNGFPFRELPEGTVAVVERQAGYLSPALLRLATMVRLAQSGAVIRWTPVLAVDRTPALRLADGGVADYDVIVVAAGPWTPALLAASDMPVDRLRTKQIQYTVYQGKIAGLGVFVDDVTGLYGRPDGQGQLLLGLPCDRWDVDPGDVRPDAGLVERVADRARSLLGQPAAGRAVRTVAACDCYRDPPGLELRPVTAGAPVFTFTGGSGGAAKTVLAASRRAATALLNGG